MKNEQQNKIRLITNELLLFYLKFSFIYIAISL